MMLPDSPERANFLSSALKWSGKDTDTSNPGSFGHPRLHQSVALTLWKGFNVSDFFILYFFVLVVS